MPAHCPRRRDETPPPDAAFWTAVGRRVQAVDLAVVFAVPVVLVAVHLLPAGVRDGLAFQFDRPTLVTAYATNFVHADLGHLAANLLTYLLVVPTAYLTSVLAGRRRVFFVVFGVALFVFPFVLSYAHLPFDRSGAMRGVSGVVMALAGYLSLALVDYLGARLSATLTIDHGPVVFFAGTAVIVVLAVPLTPVTAGVAVVSTAVAAAYLASLLRDLPPLPLARLFARRRLQRGGYVEFAAFGFGAFAFVLVAGFPHATAGGNATVNLYAHVVGFGSGYVASYVGMRTGGSLTYVCHCAAPDSDCEVHDSALTRSLRRILVRAGAC